MKISRPENVGPSFLGLDSSPSWDLGGGMTFPVQQDGRITPYLMSQLISSINTSRLFLPAESVSFHLYLIIFPSSVRTRRCSSLWFWYVCVTIFFILNYVMKIWNIRTAAEWRVLSVWIGNVSPPKTGSSFVFWRYSSLVFVQMTNTSCVCLGVGAAPHSNKAVIIYLVRAKTRLSNCCCCEKYCTEKSTLSRQHTHTHINIRIHTAIKVPVFLTPDQAELEGKCRLVNREVLNISLSVCFTASGALSSYRTLSWKDVIDTADSIYYTLT